ncbi:uncharacterized protein LOC143020721 [Oratosquilla oratoria]|uniref:uncharacterized protein LOC143020721 n=1 Tax=Oratosquilla oratoria TaxID=337810 RepID=UPI003F764242
MANSEVQTDDLTIHIHEVHGGLENQLVNDNDDDENGSSIRVVADLGEERSNLDTDRSTIDQSDGTAATINQQALQEEIHYVSTNDAGDSVTFVYPHSALPLLTTGEQGLVNLVELPGVQGSIALDQNTLGGTEGGVGQSVSSETGVVLHNDFTSQGPVTVVTADGSNGQISLLNQSQGGDGAEGQSNATHTITYLSANDSGDGGVSASSMLTDQLIQIPASDHTGANHTITLPLSFISSGSGVPILQGINQLTLPIVNEAGTDTVTLVTDMERQVPTSVASTDLHQCQVDNDQSSGNSASMSSSVLKVSSSSSSDLNSQTVLDSRTEMEQSTSPVAVKSGQGISVNKSYGNKQSYQTIMKKSSTGSNKKLIGSGPLAISAQGVVQKIGNRFVTVLPRPEDLKKLQESKSLILSPSRSSHGTARRVPVPVRPHHGYGRRGRGAFRGRTSHTLSAEHSSSTRPLSILKKENNSEGNSMVSVLTDQGKPIKQEWDQTLTDSKGNIVVGMTLPSGDPVSALLMNEQSELQSEAPDFIGPAIFPAPISKRGRRKKRGRGRPRGTFVISSSGRRRGRPRKVETLMEGPNGARMIHTGPDTRLLDQQKEEEDKLLETKGEREDMPGDDDLGVHLSKEEHDEIPHVKEEPIEPFDPSKRRLPPRRRGTRYNKLIEALIKHENEDDDFSDGGEEEDASPDYYTYRRPPPPPKPKGTSGPGKRGRPRKYAAIPAPAIKTEVLDNSSIQLTTNSSIGADPLHVEAAPVNTEKQHNFLITFQRPETGEMVIQQVMMLSNGSTTTTTTTTTTGENTSVEAIPQDEPETITGDIPVTEIAEIDPLKDESKSDDGHKCEECGMLIQHKRDYIRHLRLKHNLRPLECDQCGKGFTDENALSKHKKLHGLERPYKCDYCGKGFNEASHLKAHIMTHTGERPYHCEECGKTFVQASQLKKHKTVHDEVHQFRCSVCGKTFAHRDTLYTHTKTHNVDRPYVCDICSHGFVTSSGLNRHRKVHRRTMDPDDGMPEELRCSVCQANFSYKRTLTKHMVAVHGKTLTGEDVDEYEDTKFQDPEIEALNRPDPLEEQLEEKLNEGYAPTTSELYDEPRPTETLESLYPVEPFKCGICEETFTDVDVLCDHYTTCHTGDQSVYCDVCSVGCANEKQLLSHKDLHVMEEHQSIINAVPTAEFPYVCQMCGKSFRKMQDFTKHHKTHTAQKPYKCDLCGTGFPIKSALDKHVLVHTGERPFKCDVCLKSFRQSAALVRHKLWTHRLKNQNKCDLCAKNFFTASLLSYHLSTHGEAGEKLKAKLQESYKEEEQDSMQDEDQQVGSSEVSITLAHTNVKIDDSEEKQHTCDYCDKTFPTYVALLTHKLSHKLSASFKCDVCHRTFREKRYLHKHKLTHKGLKNWRCDICKKAFATKLTLIRHSHVHLREALKPGTALPIIQEEGDAGEIIGDTCSLPTVLKCDECNIDFEHKSHYVRHKLLHSGTPLLKCGLCGKMFVHKSDIMRHKVMHSFMFTCDVCGRNFHKRSLFILHKRKHQDDKPYKCEVCEKRFSTSGNYNTHKRIHSGEKPYRCDICDYRCSQSGRLMKHKRMHSGEKPFQCETCGKYFANAESIKVHMRIHTGERPFRCGNCDRTFINNSSLNQHMRDHIREEMFKCDMCNHKFRREHHLNKHRQFHLVQQQFQNNTNMGIDSETTSEPLMFMCEICGRVFDKRKYLYTHSNVHSRQRSFSCTYCGKDLASRLALKNHTMIHTGEMPFKCNLCGKQFRSSSNLKRHERTHTEQDALHCDVCDETFYSPELLTQHKNTHMQLMMMNPSVDGVGATDNSHHLYVFEAVGEVGEGMDSSQPLLVDNNQQQFLMDSTQPLLVFPETTPEPYSELSEPQEPEPEPEPEPTEPTEVLLPTKIESVEEEEERVVEKPYRCDCCGKCFAKKQYLTKHKYRHREVKPHACDVCGKRFAQKFEVSVHKIKHTGARPYECDVCHKPFRSKVNLMNHKMKHTGEYPFLCSVCHKGFLTQLQLERHVSLHTGSHPFRCDMCHRGYTQRTNLIKHLARTHNIHEVQQIEAAAEEMENAEAVGNMETAMEGVTAIEGVEEVEAILPTVGGVDHQEVRPEQPEDLEGGDTAQPSVTMDGDLLGDTGEPTYSIVEVHSDYLKDYLLGGPQVVSTQDMDPKILQSILQQVRASGEENTAVTITSDNQAVVHVIDD